MHPYVTDSNERIYIPLYLAIISIFSAWILFTLSEQNNLNLPWWIHAPSVLGFYGLYYKIFDTWLWRNAIIKKIGLVKLPNLNGTWEGFITSSYDNHDREHKASIEIYQTWTRISAILKTENSQSHSLMAMIIAKNPLDTTFSYEYINEPKTNATDKMHTHRGTARLNLGNNFETLYGEYYTGRDRSSFGNLCLKRISE